MFLPFFAFFAALALAWFQGKLKQVIKTKRIPKMTIWILIFCIILLNLYQAYGRAPHYYAGEIETNYLRTVENVERHYSDNPKTFLIFTSDKLDFNKTQAFQQVYGLPREGDQIIVMDASKIADTNQAMDLIKQGNTFVIFPPLSDVSLQNNIEEQISGLGQQQCGVTDSRRGNLQFVLWYPPGLDVCIK